MRLDSIRIEGFLGHVDTKVDLRAVHTAVITGPVGAGKSSIIDALTWSLYGEARGRTLDQLIHEGSDRATVTAVVTVGPDRYQVTRMRRRGHDSSLLVERDEGPGWLTLTHHTNAETEAALAERLGVDYQPLLAGPFMLQSDTGALMRVSAAARKQLLLDLMVGGSWDRWAIKAKNAVSECSLEVQGIDAFLRGVADTPAKLKEARRALTDLAIAETSADEEEQAAIEAASNLMARLTIVRAQSEEATRLTAEQADVLARFQTARATVDDLLRKMSAARFQYGDLIEKRPPRPDQSLEQARADRTQAMADITAEGQEFARLKAMVHLSCPVCSADVVCPNGHDLAGPPEEEVAAAQQRWQDAKKALEAADVAEQKLRLAGEEWERHARKLSDLNALVTSLDAQHEAAKPLVVELANRGKAISDRLSELGTVVSIATVEKEVAASDERLRLAREVHRDTTRRRADCAALIGTLETDEKNRVTWLEQRTAADRRGDIALTLSKAFGRDGVPTLMLESSLPVMEARANEVLARMPGGMRLQLRTQRNTQKATVRETLDVIVVIDGNERDYELLSGGQRFRVDLALRLGLTQVLSRKRIGTLIVDEGFDRWQDPEGRQAVLDTLTAVAEDFERVLVVSHHPDVIERFGTRIEVTMEGGVSRVG